MLHMRESMGAGERVESGGLIAAGVVDVVRRMCRGGGERLAVVARRINNQSCLQNKRGRYARPSSAGRSAGWVAAKA